MATALDLLPRLVLPLLQPTNQPTNQPLCTEYCFAHAQGALDVHVDRSTHVSLHACILPLYPIYSLTHNTCHHHCQQYPRLHLPYPTQFIHSLITSSSSTLHTSSHHPSHTPITCTPNISLYINPTTKSSPSLHTSASTNTNSSTLPLPLFTPPTTFYLHLSTAQVAHPPSSSIAMPTLSTSSSSSIPTTTTTPTLTIHSTSTHPPVATQQLHPFN
jgi:hypothetical protein